MAIGFEIRNFEVQNVYRGPDIETLKKCCEGGTNLLFLENRDKLATASIKHLIAIHIFFTNKELSEPEPGQEKEWKEKNVPIIRASFDDKLIQDSKVVLALKASDTEPKSSKAKAPKEEDTEISQPKQPKKETKMAAKKAAKKTAKKPAKKAAASGAKRGRKGPYELTDKITSLVKENPCHAEFNGKPGQRYLALQIILKNPGITVEDYFKKGGNLHHLTGLAGMRKNPKYVKVAGK